MNTVSTFSPPFPDPLRGYFILTWMSLEGGTLAVGRPGLAPLEPSTIKEGALFPTCSWKSPTGPV